MPRRLLVAALAIALPASLTAQAAVLLSEADVRAAVTLAASRAKGDSDTFRQEAATELQRRNPAYALDRIPWVAINDAIGIGVMGPVQMFVSNAAERVRKMEPISDAAWGDDVSVVVSPSTISAPDIIKIVVTRDGALVEPRTNGLKPDEFKTRMGAVRSIHAGPVTFPRAAFLPGATVVVTAIPQTGQNFVLTLTGRDLDVFQ